MKRSGSHKHYNKKAQHDASLQKLSADVIASRKKAFLEWCGARGIVIHPKIQLQYFDAMKGWGFNTFEAIEKDEILLAVPSEMQIDSDAAMKRWPEVGKVIVGTDLDEHTTLVLACMIEMLKKSASQWNPYFAFVRSFVPSSPYFWSHEDREQLAGTYAAKLLAEDLNVSEHFERHVLPALKKAKGGLGKLQSQMEDVEFFKKINYFIMSRAFPLGKTSGRIIPGADIFNAKVTDFDAVVSDQPDKKHCVVVAIRPIEANREIFVTYGTLPNSRLLLRYGYVEDRNPYDQVEFDSSLLLDVCGSVREDLTEDQLERIADFCDANADDIGFSINEPQIIGADAKPPEDLIKLFAIFNLEGPDLEKFLSCKEKESLATPEKFCSDKAQLEKSIDKCLLLCAVQRLTEYSSTIQEDESLLANGIENFNERCAVLLRLSEKRILNSLIESIRKKHHSVVQKEEKKEKREAGPENISAKKQKKGDP